MSQRTIVILSASLFVLGLLWGGFTLIAYLGIPVHQLVFSTQEEIQSMDTVCGAAADIGTYLCRGSATVFPFVVALAKMASPFLMYFIISLALWLCTVMYCAYRTGYFALRLTVRPIAVVGMFALSVWLIATSFTVGTFYNAKTPDSQMVTDERGHTIYPPVRRFYEPTPEVYGGVGPEGMKELTDNFKQLEARGCLGTPIGQIQGGTRVYNLSLWCMQTSIVSRVGGQMVMVLLFILNLLVLGRTMLQGLGRRKIPLLGEMMFSVGLGALGWIAILWLLSIFSLLKGGLVLALFLGMPVVLFWNTFYWAKASWEARFDIDEPMHSVTVLVFWLLLSYLALNFLNVVRPFPIGWDDLGSYLNRPRLLASYGSFIPSMSQFQWEYLTSIGFLIFGFDSPFGSTFAMQINWTAGLLAALSVYAFGRIFLGRRGGLVAAMMYYFLPMTGHFSFADMKIDNAVFFTGTLAVLALCMQLFGAPGLHEGDEGQPPWHPHGYALLIVAGLLAGLSFAIKPTAILTVLMMLSILGGALFGPFGFSAMAMAGLGVLMQFGALDLGQVALRLGGSAGVNRMLFAGTAFAIGAALLTAGMHRHRRYIRPFFTQTGILIGCVVAACIPWMAFNVWLAGSFSAANALKAVDVMAPQFFYSQKDVPVGLNPKTPVRVLPPELALNPDDPACKSSARVEELDRYWGFEKGWGHYLTLPWRQVMNIDSFGYYVTLTPMLLVVPLLLLLPYFWRKEARWLRLLFAGSMVFMVQWMFTGNGIVWYGIGMFLGFSIAMEAFVRRAPDPHNRILYGLLITFSVLICLTNRLWQFDTQRNLFEYPIGKVSATALREMTIPNYDDIREQVVQRHDGMPDTPYTYRIGTFISYFIPKNREVLPLADHQMGFFSCLNQEQDHALTIRRLKALGFNSIIFDTNTQTIEKDPNGPLHRKVAAFLDFANNEAVGLTIDVNDPGNGIAYILLP